MSRILCIIDGMTDPQFCAEHYPTLFVMHHIADVDTCHGAPPESLGCILRLLGLQDIPPWLRGYAEALGADIEVGERDLILRGSWYGVDQNGCCTVPVEAPETLNSAENCRYVKLEQYKSLLILPQQAAEIESLRTYPPYDCAGLPAERFCPEGSAILRSLFTEQLQPERVLIPWGESVPAKLPSMKRKTAFICGTNVVKGIARLLQSELIVPLGATGDTDTDLRAKALAALEAAERVPQVVLHINGADEASHRRDAAEKRCFLQQVDRELLPLLLRSEHEVCVVADHGTDPASGSHLSALQPVYSNHRKPISAHAERKRDWAIRQLQRRAAELGHWPRKADFDEVTRCRIKYALGPWPRALEAAGLKEKKPKSGKGGRQK